MQTADDLGNIKYLVQPVCAINIHHAIKYFNDLHRDGLLKHRIPEIKNVNVHDAYSMLTNPTNQCYVVYEVSTATACGEFMLNNFQGKAAQMHFSIGKAYHGKDTFQISVDTLNVVAKYVNSDGTSYLNTLIGATPASNKLAIRHLKRTGWEVKAQLQDAFFIADQDRYEDAVLSQFNLKELR